ncbi:YhdP family protein [Alishewanella sp. d11]|uniref:YhdP family protein n=1 Tax=Alishewanella sp. d11 TaxID=3414030 RepID=UPI003BF88AD2
MQKTKQACYYCLHKLWIALAMCLVVLATVVSLLRIALPYAESYKDHIEQVLSQQLGVTVAIENINATWHKYGPALLLQDVHVVADSKVQLEIAEASIRINFWQSILSRQFTAEHFELNGLRYWLNLDTLLSANTTSQPNPAARLQGLEQLFFRRLKDFSLKDSELILVSQEQPEQVLEISRLNWRNEGLRHQGEGEFAIAGVTANNLSVILDLQGTTLSDANGKLYVQSAQLDLLPLFRQWLPQTSRLQKASINLEAWGTIEQGQLKQVQLELTDNRLHWQRAGEQYSLKLGAGQLLWQPTAEGWQLFSSEMSLASQQEQWSGWQLQLSQIEDRLFVNLHEFELAAIEPLLQLFAEDSQLVKNLLAHQLTGHLQQLHLSLKQDAFRLYGQFTEFGSQPRQDLPGFASLKGQFWAANDFAWLLLSGEQEYLSWDGLFADNWYYQQLNAEIRLIRENAVWQLSLPTFQLDTADFQLHAKAQLDLQEQPELALLAQLTALDAAKASHYFPQRYMPSRTRDYLTTAIDSGQLTQATVLWQGAFHHYPFRQAEGHFQVRADLEDVVLQFAPDWPALTELNATLWFENASMLIEANGGYLGLLSLTEPVTASITDLFNAQQLDVRLNKAIDSATLTEFMLQSPLQANLGKTLAHLGLSGPIQGDLLLEIGLTKPSVIASGSAELLGVSANIQAPRLDLQQLTGRIHFRNEQLKAEQLQFLWHGLPAKGEFTGEQQSAGYQLNLTLAGAAQAEQINTVLATPQDVLAGSLDWQFELALVLPPQGFSYQAQWQAQLAQLALSLPAPYEKPLQQAAQLQLIAHGDTEQSYITGDYQQLLHFQAELSHQTGRISRAQLTFGDEDLGLSSKGFNIDVNLPQVELVPWISFLQPLLANSSGNNALFPALNKVRGKIGKVELPAQFSLTNTVFELTPSEDAWQLNLYGTELASRWQFFHDWQNKGMAVQLDYLHLPYTSRLFDVPNSDVEPQTEIALPLAELKAQNWLTEIVPLQLNCNDCSLGNYRFGKVQLQSIAEENAWYLKRFTSDYKGNKLSITGEWQPDNLIGLSQFQGTFFTPNLGALLAEYQISSAISGSRSDIAFQLNWAGAPQQFRLEQLNGKVQFNLGDGSLTEVSDQGARLFSLFSLDSLVRKLRLDFRDVFSKGFFYNKMNGSLTLHQGVAQTSDVTIDGVPGNLSIQGYADLVKREMDYQMSFAPKVTSSLPVIIAWMVNPATGLAALALDEVFQSAEVISRINFTVTGSFDQPVVTEVNRHSTEVPVPIRVAQPEPITDDNNQPRSD